MGELTGTSLAAQLRLRDLGGAYAAGPVPSSRSRGFGGRLLAHMVDVARRSVPDEIPFASVHAFFLHAVDNDQPVEFTSHSLKEGHRFHLRQIEAVQQGQLRATAVVTFARASPGFAHTTPPTPAPGPEACETVDDHRRRQGSRTPLVFAREFPGVELRQVDTERSAGVWMRVLEPLGDRSEHERALVFLSDLTLLSSSLRTHPEALVPGVIEQTTLDHALWLHAPEALDCTEWMLYEQTSPAASSGRTLCQGRVYTSDGILLASTCQEGLARWARTS